MGPGKPFPADFDTDGTQKPTLVEQLTPQKNGQIVQPTKQGCESWSAAWSPDGSSFAWSCGHGIVKLLRRSEPQYAAASTQEDDDSNDSAPSFFDNNHTITIDTGDRVWSLAFGCRQFTSTHAQTLMTSSLDMSHFRYKRGKDLLLAVGLNNGRIRVYDAMTGKLHLELLDHRDVVRDLRFAPNASQTLVSASRDGTLKVWELQDDGNMTKTLKSNSKWLYACAWAPDAKTLASVGDNRSVIIWDMVTYKLLHKLVGHLHDVCCCDYSPDGALLATSSCDTRVILWNAQTGQIFRELLHMYPPPSPIFAGGANDAYVRGVSWSRDGSHLATISDDTYLRFWDTSKAEMPCQVVSIDNALCCVYSPDGSTVAVGTRNGTMSFWLAPMRVQSLQHACRQAIRRGFPTAALSRLLLPTQLKQYIQAVAEV